jgi:chitin synthase
VLTYGDKKANYYIAFIILSEALEDPSFKLPWIHILNSVLNYFYVGLLVMCFILSLGNRPQGSKWGYTLAMIGFALITIYMTVCPIIISDLPFCFIALSTHIF